MNEISRELGLSINYDNYTPRLKKRDEETTIAVIETRICSKIESIKTDARRIKEIFEKSCK
jgi:hypothetical protein